MSDPFVEGAGFEADVKIDLWLQDLLPRTPGAMRKVVRREFINACREFYEQSFAWRVVTGPKDLRADKKQYYMTPYDPYTDVVGVLGVELDGQPLAALVRRPRYADRTATLPSSFWLETPDTVRLWPLSTTDKDDSLLFSLALTPKQTVRHLPKFARSHHYDALLDGALGRLYAHPAKPYSNPGAAEYHLKRFQAAIGKYAGLAKKGYGPGLSWQFPRFGK